MPTHEVTNQPPPLAGYDASDDPALLAALSPRGPLAAEGGELRGVVGGVVSGQRRRLVGDLVGGHGGRLAVKVPG